jgi:hypothetical protein
MTPQRIQLCRRRGWRKPEGAIAPLPNRPATAIGTPLRALRQCAGRLVFILAR